MIPIAFLLLTSAQTPTADPGHPTAEVLHAQADRCDRLLQTSLIDFYLPACLDREHGGYLETWKNGRFTRTGEKFLVLQARQLWFFSTLAARSGKPGPELDAARSGFDFLQSHMLDPTHGGYVSKVTDDGKAKDPRKHIYLNAFVIYGLVAYHQASRDPAALTAAQNLFQTLEQHAYDAHNGGYNEFFTADWQPIDDPSAPGYVGAIGTKTYNTHLHLLEALTSLYRAWPDESVRRRLAELLLINVQTVRHPVVPCNIDGWRPDWTIVQMPANLRASYGHDIECAWLVLDAAHALGQPEATLRHWAVALVGNSLRDGFDRTHGGFYYSGPAGAPADDTKKEWWVQAEALPSMLTLYRQTGKPAYYDIFARTLDFIERHQLAPGGGWFATRNADGSSRDDGRSSPWHEPYHGGRALLLSADGLRNLADRPPNRDK